MLILISILISSSSRLLQSWRPHLGPPFDQVPRDSCPQCTSIVGCIILSTASFANVLIDFVKHPHHLDFDLRPVILTFFL